jgi:hypothetical protein
MSLSRLAYFFCFTLLFSSCVIPKYTHIYESTNKGLDLRNGKWLINYSNGNNISSFNMAIENKVLDHLSELGVDSIDLVRNIDFRYILPERLINGVDQETLNLLSESTDYTYLVSVKTIRVEDELLGVQLSEIEEDIQNISEVIIVVYDIKGNEKIYHQRVIGKVKLEPADGKNTITKSSTGLIYSALNRGFKEIDKYSAKNEI